MAPDGSARSAIALDPSRRWIQARGLLVRPVSTGVVAMTSGGDFVTLDAPGAVALHVFDVPTSLDDAVELLSQAYDTPASTIRETLRETIPRLVELGVLQTSP